VKEALFAQCEAQITAVRGRLAQRHSRRRLVCGAKTRKGRACRNKSDAGKARCKFYGDKSTGPKTPEGKVCISTGQKARWAA